MSDNKPTECMFVNLAEKLAIQNQVIIQTMDEIIERATMSADQLKEKYSAQVQKTLEATLVGDLTMGCNREGDHDDVPKPKSLNHRKSTKSQDSLI